MSYYGRASEMDHYGGGGGGGGGYGRDRGGDRRGYGDRGGYDRRGPPGGGGGHFRNSGRNWRDRELGNSKGGAEHLARIHGTEEDKVNCPFYFKIGACRHGDRCSRQHNKPPFSQTILLKHMYKNPASATVGPPVPGQRPGPQGANDAANQEGLEEFEDFYEEVFDELSNFGNLEELHVCDNMGDHMLGNVYAKYSDEEEADAARTGLNGRYYAGTQLVVEFSPVTDFREARCRQYDEGQCTYGPYCNFLHVKRIGRSLRRELEKRAAKKRREKEREEEGGDKDDRSRSRSRERSSRRRSSRSRSRDRGSSRRRSRSGSRRDKKDKDKEGGGSGRSRHGSDDEGGESSRGPDKENDGDERNGTDRSPTPPRRREEEEAGDDEEEGAKRPEGTAAGGEEED